MSRHADILDALDRQKWRTSAEVGALLDIPTANASAGLSELYFEGFLERKDSGLLPPIDAIRKNGERVKPRGRTFFFYRKLL